jgi:hypothetical protein
MNASLVTFLSCFLGSLSDVNQQSFIVVYSSAATPDHLNSIWSYVPSSTKASSARLIASRSGL